MLLDEQRALRNRHLFYKMLMFEPEYAHIVNVGRGIMKSSLIATVAFICVIVNGERAERFDCQSVRSKYRKVRQLDRHILESIAEKHERFYANLISIDARQAIKLGVSHSERGYEASRPSHRSRRTRHVPEYVAAPIVNRILEIERRVLRRMNYAVGSYMLKIRSVGLLDESSMIRICHDIDDDLLLIAATGYQDLQLALVKVRVLRSYPIAPFEAADQNEFRAYIADYILYGQQEDVDRVDALKSQFRVRFGNAVDHVQDLLGRDVPYYYIDKENLYVLHCKWDQFLIDNNLHFDAMGGMDELDGSEGTRSIDTIDSFVNHYWREILGIANDAPIGTTDSKYLSNACAAFAVTSKYANEIMKHASSFVFTLTHDVPFTRNDFSVVTRN